MIHVGHRSRGATCAKYCLAALALGTVITLLIVRAAFPTPFQDELTFNTLFAPLARREFPALSELVAAHNGHPYLLLKLIVAITILGGLPWAWMMYAQVGVLGVCALVVYLVRRERLGSLAGAVVLLVLFSPRQWENFYWAMQLAFPMSLLFSLASFAAADRYAVSTHDPRWAYAALVSGLGASVSNGAGIFALGLASVAVMLVGRAARVRLAAVIALALGTGLFVYAQMLAPRSGVGGAPIDLARAVEHAVRMVAHQFVDAPSGSLGTLVLGVAGSFIITYAVMRAASAWRECLFELLCIVLSLLLIAGVTYSRITAGIFQPDASRYLPLLAPLTIGTVLLLDRWGRRAVLVGVLSLVVVGYVLALRSEWRISPHRQLNMLAAHQELCVNGRVHPIHNMKAQIPEPALYGIRNLFCGNLVAGARRIDHENINRSAVSGFYREQRHTWASPRLRLLLHGEPRLTRVQVVGWLPDTDAYEDGRFAIEVVSQDTVLGRLITERPGDFSLAADLPMSTDSLEVRASARKQVAGDNRDLSWVLVSIAFQ